MRPPSLSDGKYFTGLAIPAAAGVVASLVIFDHYIVRMGAEVKPILVLIMTLAALILDGQHDQVSEL